MVRLHVFWASAGLLIVQALIILYWCQRQNTPAWKPVMPSHSGSLQLTHPTHSRLSMLQIQEERKLRIREVCADPGITFPGKTWSYDDIPEREFQTFFAIDQRKIAYCAVAKVACTNWKRVLAALNVHKDPNKVSTGFGHSYFDKWKKGKHLSSFMKPRLKSYRSFLFIRHPFVRLISLFRNKFESPNSYLFNYAVKMVMLYNNVSQAPESSEKMFADGINPTFTHFIQYLLDPKNERGFTNIHWRPFHQTCHPCQIDYDFIGKMETMDEDNSYLLNFLNIETIFHFPSKYTNQSTTALINKYFATVPISWRKKLYLLYEPDFLLFGYPKPNYLFDEGE
ncbi:carbohydrate sulfotransferase 12-like [Callorhinchus milii]|nr:carbohydrate sulfotransferase 12-like [Callorhinchus milii]XP_042198417.1 carbohydrate sulfotransferase 12-like [Callorhinchus milii]